VVRSDHLDQLEEDADVQVAGLVVARQRPETAKGYSFILLEDQAGMINAIVRPDIYDRDRIAIRTEPYLWILGKLAKDDGTVNVITKEVRPLRLRKRAVKEQPETAYGQSPYKFLKNLRRGRSQSRDWF
jgi:error-prone DNA polymerase